MKIPDYTIPIYFLESLIGRPPNGPILAGIIGPRLNRIGRIGPSLIGLRLIWFGPSLAKPNWTEAE